MPGLLLATKLYLPPPRLKVVSRPRLFAQLNEGMGRKLTLISASAGAGKTTLLSEWLAGCGATPGAERPVAWLSLDHGDSDPTRFLTYLIAALQTLAPQIGAGSLAALQSPQPPPAEVILTALLNEVASLSSSFLIVLDDYHTVDAPAVDQAITFLLDHQPPQMHLVIATREDPALPLARLRAGDQLTELRLADLRFTPDEAAEFLNQVMGLSLTANAISLLEARTEGWIAGLQLAALSMQGQKDRAGFIQSFSGSHRFVLDYLMEEVLQQQPEPILNFLLGTSILERLCGPLCDAVLDSPAGAGQATLERLEHLNLFTIPLDGERHWYRYHHLFGELLRQRLSLQHPNEVASLHGRASQWFQEQGLGLEAFHHAAAACDVDRAEQLIAGGGLPMHIPGAVKVLLDWLGSLPAAELDARPGLLARYAAYLLVTGQTSGVEEKLDAAERGLQNAQPDDRTRDLLGVIACARATLAMPRYQNEVMIAQAQRALALLHPANLPYRASALWVLASAYFSIGDRAAYRQALDQALAISQAAGDPFNSLLATIGLAQAQEADNQLYAAAETFGRALQLAGDPALSIAYEVELGLARIYFEWNDLEAAEQHARRSLALARQYDPRVDRYIACQAYLARVRLARGDDAGAAALLAGAEQAARENNFLLRLPEIAAVQGLVLLGQGNLAAAGQLAQAYELPMLQARVLLAQNDPATALAVLEPLLQVAHAKGWQDERLKLLVLQSIALLAQGEEHQAVQVLGEALALAEPGGFIRLFVDEGRPMEKLLASALALGVNPGYAGRLLAAFGSLAPGGPPPQANSAQELVEPLSQRELEVLALVAQGLSNQEVASRLFLALDTVKGHNRRIFEKLQVQNRTEAVARARALGLL